MRAAYHADSALEAEAALTALAAELDKTHPGAAASLREGLDQTLSVLRLGLPPTLARTFRSTNAIESIISLCRDHAHNVKRWRDGQMALRWCAAGMLAAGTQFRRVNGHLHLPKLRAEIGADMARFPSAAHLASWAGVCPGNNKTAGKAKSGHTRPGNRWLKSALGTAALGAIRRRDSYLHALFRRVAARRGGKRGLAAVAHSQLVTIWHVLNTQTVYHDLGGDYFLRRENPEHRRRRAIDQLQRLGYRVILEPAA